VIGWGIFEVGDGADGIDLFLYAGMDDVMRFSRWHKECRECADGVWTCLVAPPHQTDEKARAEALDLFLAREKFLDKKKAKEKAVTP